MATASSSSSRDDRFQQYGLSNACRRCWRTWSGEPVIPLAAAFELPIPRRLWDLEKKGEFLAMNRKQRRAAKSQGGTTPDPPLPVGRAGSSVHIAEQFAAAFSHHQAGRLVEAENLYRRI